MIYLVSTTIDGKWPTVAHIEAPNEAEAKKLVLKAALKRFPHENRTVNHVVLKPNQQPEGE